LPRQASEESLAAQTAVLHNSGESNASKSVYQPAFTQGATMHQYNCLMKGLLLLKTAAASNGSKKINQTECKYGGYSTFLD